MRQPDKFIDITPIEDLIKQYNLTVHHTGGGCFSLLLNTEKFIRSYMDGVHSNKDLWEKVRIEWMINPSLNDGEPDFDLIFESKSTQSMFGWEALSEVSLYEDPQIKTACDDFIRKSLGHLNDFTLEHGMIHFYEPLETGLRVLPTFNHGFCVFLCSQSIRNDYGQMFPIAVENLS
jgi:hypothetical protein|tara:strand:+ start:738 stop:1265 length:528 start_codon:yes stop_codon:yes gene_type:complete